MQTSPIFFDSYEEQYIIEYLRLRKQYPWWSVNTAMKVAKETTTEYFYFKLKESLRIEVIWPEGFKP